MHEHDQASKNVRDVDSDWTITVKFIAFLQPLARRPQISGCAMATHNGGDSENLLIRSWM